jgi:hypothetical protein
MDIEKPGDSLDPPGKNEECGAMERSHRGADRTYTKMKARVPREKEPSLHLIFAGGPVIASMKHCDHTRIVKTD